MFLIIIISVLFSLKALSTEQISNNTHPSFNLMGRNFIYNKYKYDTMYNLMLNSTIEQILEFYEDTDEGLSYPTRVHVSSDVSMTADNPLFVTATQKKGISSWELPLVVQTGRFNTKYDVMARTLCPHDAGPNITTQAPPLIHLTSSSPSNVTVDIQLRRVEDFYVQVDKMESCRANASKKYQLIVNKSLQKLQKTYENNPQSHLPSEVHLNTTPSTPKYYYFSFDSDPWNKSDGYHRFIPSFNYTVPKSVILIIDSDDSLCAIVSIQNNSCPVFDNEREVPYQGYHLTMTTKGGITLTQTMFPKGFYIVFIVKQGDEECTGASETARVSGWAEWERDGHMDSVPPSSVGRRKNFRFVVIATVSYTEYMIAAGVCVCLLAAFWALVVMVAYCRCRWYEEVVILEPEPGTSTSGNDEPTEFSPIIESDSEDESQSPAPFTLTLADLNKARPTAHDRRSDRYFWGVLTVSVVYALPVVQLLITYQKMVTDTGNQDLCYYNFLCAHPLGSLSDFNHIYTNVGYLVLGIAFMIQVRMGRKDEQRFKHTGIPQHPGLSYSMGLSLCMEGLLSAFYHLCPNKMNFQFDSSFMYVLAVLVMVRLYQNRHPDVNARAHTTFLFIAAVMAIGLFGIMYPSVWFWVVFTCIHLAVCFVFTLNIYYLGRFKFEFQTVRRGWSNVVTEGRSVLVPQYRARAILLAVANIANWAIAGHGLYAHNKDFARHLLAILMGNAVMYTLFYIVMKLVHREKLPIATWLYLALGPVMWGVAVWQFTDSRTKWSQTPAQSRVHNAVCSALGMFDSHDIWHLSSAAAMYLALSVLRTVDQEIRHVRRDKIPVF